MYISFHRRGTEAVETRDQVQVNLMTETFDQNEESSDYMELSQGLNFLYYLLALEE